MNHASLFSGIGGFDLVAEWMGWDNVFHCEIDNFCQQVLRYYWPEAISYADIKQTDFTIHRGKIDILTGGFPCQPFSAAGKRKGTEDDRHLWPQMLRAIREIAPRYIVGENVYGLVNWSGGLVFEQVQADLEAEGYEVAPVILPACSVNAPHRRDRIWFVAYSISGGARGKNGYSHSKRKGKGKPETINIGSGGDASNPQCSRSSGKEYGQEEPGQPTKTHPGQRWADFPTEPPIRSRNDGLSDRLDGITFPKWRNESIKAYGNAVVPQVVYEIFKTIELFDSDKNP